MKKIKYLKLLTLANFLAIIIFMGGCTRVNGDGPVVSEKRMVNSFSGIHYALQGNLHIKASAENHIEIRAQQNIINVIETFVTNNTLFIRLRNNTGLRSYEPIDIYLNCQDPNTIQLSGSGNIWVSEPISTQKLTLESSGSGHIQVDYIHTGNLVTNISGSGIIEVVSGNTSIEKIMLSGSGHALLSGILADSAFTKTSGSGDITLWANKYMDCEISGSGIVRYKGSPEINKRISGSGDVFPW